jgi:hypothetical protein
LLALLEALLLALLEALLAIACTGVISTGSRRGSSTDGSVGARHIGIGTVIVVAVAVVDLGLIFLGAGGATSAVEAVEAVTGVEGKTLVIVIGISELETPLLMPTN